VAPGKDYRPIGWTADAKGFESGQDKATIILYDDNRRAGLASGSYEWKVVTQFNKSGNRVKIGDVGLPPYNPFIITLRNNETDRAHEIHLANYKPTQKASYEWFGTGNDKSNPPLTYYISDNNYPFAIDLPVQGFRLPDEMERIDVRYPDYYDWARTHGAMNPDWYMHPKP
jgi:LruC domain-containing protein